MSETRELMARVPQIGRVAWIGVAPHGHAPIQPVTTVLAEVGTGLAGDHHATSGQPSKRQVTLIQAEHLPVVAALCGRASVEPELLRRNLLISGINLLSLKGRRFRIGSAVLEGTGSCAPCSRMERNLGSGGFQAMRGHGGITAVVIERGTISVGDCVQAE